MGTPAEVADSGDEEGDSDIDVEVERKAAPAPPLRREGRAAPPAALQLPGHAAARPPPPIRAAAAPSTASTPAAAKVPTPMQVQAPPARVSPARKAPVRPKAPFGSPQPEAPERAQAPPQPRGAGAGPTPSESAVLAALYDAAADMRQLATAIAGAPSPAQRVPTGASHFPVERSQTGHSWGTPASTAATWGAAGYVERQRSLPLASPVQLPPAAAPALVRTQWTPTRPRRAPPTSDRAGLVAALLATQSPLQRSTAPSAVQAYLGGTPPSGLRAAMRSGARTLAARDAAALQGKLAGEP